MIQIAYYSGEGTHKLIVKGHAGYSDHGNDIVCAGVSAITFTLLGFLENHWDDIESISAQVNSGDVCVRCEGNEKVAQAFEMTMIGLKQIAMKYPKHVTIDIDPAVGG